MIISREAKERLVNNGVVLVDVHNADEYQLKHIPESLLIPLSDLTQIAPEKLPDLTQEIIVHCQGGRRSKQAVKLLQKLGYTKVHDLGGINNWSYETVSGRDE